MEEVTSKKAKFNEFESFVTYENFLRVALMSEDPSFVEARIARMKKFISQESTEVCEESKLLEELQLYATTESDLGKLIYMKRLVPESSVMTLGKMHNLQGKYTDAISLNIKKLRELGKLFNAILTNFLMKETSLFLLLISICIIN